MADMIRIANLHKPAVSGIARQTTNADIERSAARTTTLALPSSAGTAFHLPAGIAFSRGTAALPTRNDACKRCGTPPADNSSNE
jgi:hypothetical protein